MTPQEIITLALTVINQANRAIELANNGDETAAEAALQAARSQFADALNSWNAAPGPDDE